jgi:hypothetical protein
MPASGKNKLPCTKLCVLTTAHRVPPLIRGEVKTVHTMDCLRVGRTMSILTKFDSVTDVYVLGTDVQRTTSGRKVV